MSHSSEDVQNLTTVQSRDIEKRAFGKATLENRCSYDVWVWSVDGKGSSKAIKVPKRTKWSEAVRSSCVGCGVVFKVSKTDQIINGKHTQFEYAIASNKIWYDISLVNCASGKTATNCPGYANGLSMDSPNAKCGKINCKGGSYCPTQAYWVDTPVQKLGIAEPVFGCGDAGASMDLNMRVCGDEKALKRSVAGRLMIDEEY
ncbi:hypothetical protein P280DRAFT_400456 [Massarina eburnea CBS 473.64]|uniref:Uncharacterized protein n=1 Tax=Massarina eburnea CBS 473.64 TaxID=1395130 RepID=A0A6A6RZC6_9PLEO|nr:hypothetical protein P280DRAFT_400456 [Massarina eburnea CBS 473.64]